MTRRSAARRTGARWTTTAMMSARATTAAATWAAWIAQRRDDTRTFIPAVAKEAEGATSRVSRERETGGDDRHIVPATTLQRHVDQALARRRGSRAVDQRAANRLVVHEIGQAVAAQHDSIAAHELELIDVHFHVFRRATQRVDEHVTRREVCRLLL